MNLVDEGGVPSGRIPWRKESRVRSFSWFVAVAGLALTATQVSAQCYYIAPPRAPDMRNPGFYYTNPYGVIYGPNYYVRPPFPPYQGAILGPQKAAALAPYADNPQAFQQAIGEFNGFPRHLYARSPRDYFMADTDPATSPYNYGYAGYGARYDPCID
jgi:hypothetical protein